ncbi:helicase ARIP4 isoform X1 [Drosophila santomea]|uniref:helicase ARIP4 isoform X1 n=2 Tax=Drosophila santomea TaxID=129105 RepID=UPI001954C79D|nr:helicase ARIP4 isoform X1 [Drosophila santomea]
MDNPEANMEESNPNYHPDVNQRLQKPEGWPNVNEFHPSMMYPEDPRRYFHNAPTEPQLQPQPHPQHHPQHQPQPLPQPLPQQHPQQQPQPHPHQQPHQHPHHQQQQHPQQQPPLQPHIQPPISLPIPIPTPMEGAMEVPVKMPEYCPEISQPVDPDRVINPLAEVAKNTVPYGHKRKNSSAEDQAANKKLSLAAAAEEKKNSHLRKNIRDVMNEDNLDSTTLAAQREESERLARVAGQQKSMREIQKQVVHKQIFRILQLDESEGIESCAVANTVEHHQPVDFPEEEIASDTFDESNSSSLSGGSIEDVLHKEASVQQPSEVVTIDDSSDDDCILLSEEEEEEDDEDLNESDDATNSGMHVKDIYNVPDENGQVVVNMAHPEGEETLYLAPQIAKVIKPHQIGGVRFLYDNIIESTRRYNKSSGFGCILAHSMGLGKTLQVVSFCDIFLRHTSAKTVLCVMPINTLQNWLSEFNMWVPRYSADGNVRARNFDIFVLNDQQKTLTARAKVILNWVHEGGVLLIGYELFRLLALKLVKTRKRKGSVIRPDGMDSSSDLMNLVYEALVKPGPDLVICDEGHRIKNSHAGISLALKQIRTRRRIVLTGYPLQNNLLEYWCMVDFVRPNYLGTRTEFCNMFERPIQNGQCVDSTPDDIKLMRYRAHVLHSLLLGFVQRRSHTVLQLTLPQKYEYVILVKMTAFQRKLYDTFMTDVVRTKAFPNPLKAFAVCCKIWNHPDVLYNFLKKCETDLDLEIDEDVTKGAATPIVEPSADSSLSLASPLEKKINGSGDPINSIETFSKAENQTLFNIPASSDLNAKYLNKSPSFYDEKPEPLNYGSFGSEAKNNYWMDSSILPKPGCVEVIKQTDTNMSSNFESITGSSEIVDLDTNEIKTVETTIQAPCTNNQLDNGCNASKTSEWNAAGSKNVGGVAAAEPFKKLLKSKQRNDEFSCSWAVDLMKNYVSGLISNSPKMEIFFCILKESLQLGDRILLFSQSLLTLNLLEVYLKSSYVPGSNQLWTKNSSYFRLDGSTSSQERERLVNEFNANSNVKLFLISTRAGSLGINLTGANRVIIFDASWNPCHDTQAVYRIYRYGQTKPCFVYRIVMDRCLEKKIYDRQIKKQGMSDRIVDECNPEAHLSMKDITNLCHDYDSDEDTVEEVNKSAGDLSKPGSPSEDGSKPGSAKIKIEVDTNMSPEESSNKSNNGPSKPLDDQLEPKSPNGASHSPIKNEKNDGQEHTVHFDAIINTILDMHRHCVTKEPFLHESLLVDQKDRKLSQAEKRQAHRSYELEKKAAVNQRFTYAPAKMHYKIVNNDGTVITKPMNQQIKTNTSSSTGGRSTRWIPADVWQRQGMTAQEMTLPLDVVIPTNSADKANIILKAGQRVMVLKSAKGIYMQLDSGKIIAIRTTAKTEPEKTNKDDVIDITDDGDTDTAKPQSPEEDVKDLTADDEPRVVKSKESTPATTSRTEMPTKERKSTENVHFKPQTQPNTTLATPSNHHQMPSDLSYPQPSQTHSQQQSHQQSQPQSSQQQPAQQPPPPAYKHQNHVPAAGEGYSNANSIQPNAALPPHPGAPNSEAPPPADSSYFQPKPFQHTYPPQYYDYYDNKHKSAPPASSYHINNYTSYGNLNFAPYHSNLHPPASYIGAPSSYVNSNVFPRQHWSSVVNSPASSESIRQPSYIGSTYPINEWSSQ